MGLQLAAALAGAQPAIAIPLREAATGTRTEDEDLHDRVPVASGSAVRDVHRDLEAEAHIFERGLRPMHGSLLGVATNARADCLDGHVFLRKTHAGVLPGSDRGRCATAGQWRSPVAQGFPWPVVPRRQ